MVADDRADLLATLRWGYEWDVAAATLIAREAGAAVSDAFGQPLSYNKRDPRAFGVLVSAPAIHRAAVDRLAGRAALHGSHPDQASPETNEAGPERPALACLPLTAQQRSGYLLPRGRRFLLRHRGDANLDPAVERAAFLGRIIGASGTARRSRRDGDARPRHAARGEVGRAPIRRAAATGRG